MLQLALVLWAASSFVEYKIVKSSPHLKYWFHGVPGILISLAISLAIGLTIAPAAGVSVQLAAFLGLATNEFTYKFYDGLARLNASRRDAVAKVTTFKTSHPKVFNEAIEGVKAGFKMIGGIFLAIIWIFGLPVRIVHWTQSGYASASSRVRSVLPTR